MFALHFSTPAEQERRFFFTTLFIELSRCTSLAIGHKSGFEALRTVHEGRKRSISLCITAKKKKKNDWALACKSRGRLCRIAVVASQARWRTYELLWSPWRKEKKN